jgi:PilX N-terminal
MNIPTTSRLKDEAGMAIVFVLLILTVLIIVGVTSMSTSTVEIQVATHDARHKLAFYQADGGAQYSAELLEQNICCTSGFPTSTIGELNVVTPALWMNTSALAASDTNRDLFYPSTYSGSEPHTNVSLGGVTTLAAGGAIQMAAGYEGKGKGAPSGGAHII